MAYIGKGFKDIATANIAVNTMVGDGSDTTLGLSMGSKGVGSVNDVSVFVGGIQQRPGTDFTLSGSTITFTTAPVDGIKVVAMSHGDSWNNAPSDNTVTAAKLKDASVTSDKIIGLDAGKLSGSLSGSGANLTNLNAANISGTLPAIDGSALTGVSPYENETSEPTATENKTLGTMWVNKTSGEMYILTDDTTNANVWTNVGGGTGQIPALPTGGTITEDGDYKVHTFNSSGTFEIPNLSIVLNSQVEYLVVAGGGGGGTTNYAAGAGAGGYLTASAFSVSQQNYSITVGAGGAGSTNGGVQGTNGSVSIFSSITSTGGGGGGGYSSLPGLAGGSGGGGGGYSTYSTAGAGGAASPAGQGNAGAHGGQGVGAGGGGAGQVGQEGTPLGNGGDGGAGLASSITGSSVFRAGGGGGSFYTGGNPGSGGNGGGGAANVTIGQPGDNATVNTGGGGGAGSAPSGDGGAGGSGVVILRYKFK